MDEKKEENTGKKDLSQSFIEIRLSLIEYAMTHTLAELLTQSLDEVGAFVDSPIGFYHFVEPDQKTLALQQWSTRTLKEFCRAAGKGTHYNIDQAGVWVDCLRQKKAVIHNDYSSLPHKKGLPEGHAEVVRELVVPVIRKDKVVAILGVGNKPIDYTQQDVEVVSYLADVTWEIVKQKRADEALQRAHDELQIRVEERTKELAAQNQQLQNEIREREKAEEELQRSSEKIKLFAYSVAHDLKNPAIATHGLAIILGKKYGDTLTDRGKRICEQIQRSSEDIVSLVDKINIFISAKETPLNIGEIYLKEVFQILQEEFSSQLNIRSIQWSIPDKMPDTIVADRLSIVRIFRNIIENSLKYGGDELTKITIGYRSTDILHIFTITDDGQGLEAKDSINIFNWFKRKTTSTEIHGAGMGLAIVKEIAALHGGEVWQEPAKPKGITFCISLSRHLVSTGEG